MDLQALQIPRQKERVLDELGEKVLAALSGAIDETRDDLRDYWRIRPDFVEQSSPRGMANWIHDRFWSNACHLLDSVDGVVCLDKRNHQRDHCARPLSHTPETSPSPG